MDKETAKALAAHIRKLTKLATNSKDEDRRLDAVRSLGAMALIADGVKT